MIVVDGNHEQKDYNELTILDHVQMYLDDGISEKDAIKMVAKERNVAKGLIYHEYHSNKKVEK